MTTSYLNPEEFDKQLADKKLNAEDLAEILNLEIKLAKNIFAGHKSIPQLELLKLHEIVGFSYLNLITSKKTPNENKPVKKVSPKKPRLENNQSNPILKNPYLDIDEKNSCEKCNFFIYNPVNFCPNCGELLPQLIRQDKTIPDEDKSLNE
jgi:hypothetical protein